MNIRQFIDTGQLPSVIIYSDASDVACASFVSINGIPTAHRSFTLLEMQQSSTWRELFSVKYALESFFVINQK
jgi:hypothetical protein